MSGDSNSSSGSGATLDSILGAVGKLGDTYANLRDRFRDPEPTAGSAVPIPAGSAQQGGTGDAGGGLIAQLRNYAPALALALGVVVVGVFLVKKYG
jgi:hypothetical protein